jgi:hypothetical protein
MHSWSQQCGVDFQAEKSPFGFIRLKTADKDAAATQVYLVRRVWLLAACPSHSCVVQHDPERIKKYIESLPLGSKGLEERQKVLQQGLQNWEYM